VRRLQVQVWVAHARTAEQANVDCFWARSFVPVLNPETSAAQILTSLADVGIERAIRRDTAGLEAKVRAVKDFQHRRFKKTYADVLAYQRYSAAARFFLEELYGPADFTERDIQFARIVPALVRLFPKRIVQTVGQLARLHALSESLDTAMASCILSPDLNASTYVIAWQSVARRGDRLLQIQLMRSIGEALDRYTRVFGLRQSLHLMRRPAQLAGLASLQAFLERGFDTFGAMGGATEFLQLVDQRETDLVDWLFKLAQPDGTESTELQLKTLALLP
jgi:hypothetical protein